MRSSTSVKSMRTFFCSILSFPNTQAAICNQPCNEGWKHGGGQSEPRAAHVEVQSDGRKRGVFFLFIGTKEVL